MAEPAGARILTMADGRPLHIWWRKGGSEAVLQPYSGGTPSGSPLIFTQAQLGPLVSGISEARSAPWEP